MLRLVLLHSNVKENWVHQALLKTWSSGLLSCYEVYFVATAAYIFAYEYFIISWQGSWHGSSLHLLEASYPPLRLNPVATRAHKSNPKTHYHIYLEQKSLALDSCHSRFELRRRESYSQDTAASRFPSVRVRVITHGVADFGQNETFWNSNN